MFTGSMLGIILVLFLSLLFVIALIGEKLTISDNTRHVIYSLALGVHCTTWAMFGTVSQAANYGWSLIPTYLGMMLVMFFGFQGLKQVAQLSIQHNIASLADFMSFRFKQSFGLPAIVTIVCVLGVIPYISMQLDSISATVTLLLPSSTLVSEHINWFVALSMAVFALFFGTRSKSLSPKHPGLLLLVASTSIVKVIALLLISIWVCYGLFDGIYDVFIHAAADPIASQSLTAPTAWYTYSVHVFLGVVSMFCLPRQFHMTFVELPQLQALNKGRWILPLYLLLMSIGVLPIALAGKMLLVDEAVSSDIFTLALPLYMNQTSLTIIAFIGGFAAATAMIIVSTLALGIMLGNHIASPLYVFLTRYQTRKNTSKQIQGQPILWFRRITVGIVIFAAYFYHIHVSQTMPLVNSGFIAMALVAQLFPSFVLTNILPRPNVSASISAIIAGSIIWFLLILYPIIQTNDVNQAFLTDTQLNHGLIISLIINIFIYVIFYGAYRLRVQQRSEDVPIKDEMTNFFIRKIELLRLCRRLLPGRNIDNLFDQLQDNDYVPNALLSKVLSLVANQVGYASAKLLFNTISDTPDTEFEKGEWVKQTQALTQAKDSAIRENVLKTQFLAAAGHDLMQPFNAAQLFAALLAEKNTQPDLSEITSGLIQSLDNAENLLTMLLDMSKLESGVISPNQQAFCIDEVIKPLIAEFSIIAENAKVHLTYVPSRSIVISDKLLLKRIIQNLLANAIRYTSYQPASSARQRVSIGVRRYTDTVDIWVCDTGPGIPVDKQTEIFAEFTQLHHTPHQHGLGLGLTIVDKMAQLLEHPINLVSEVGKGTRFSITIPRVASKSSFRPVNEQYNEQDGFLDIANDSNLSMLLIENDAQVASAMLSLFTQWQFSVKWIKQRAHLVELGKNELANINVVICDYHLNFGETGVELYKYIQDYLPNKHIAVLTTADRSIKIRQLAHEHGLLYLPKPIKPIALKHMLNRYRVNLIT